MKIHDIESFIKDNISERYNGYVLSDWLHEIVSLEAKELLFSILEKHINEIEDINYVTEYKFQIEFKTNKNKEVINSTFYDLQLT